MTKYNELIIEVQGQVKGFKTKLDDIDMIAVWAYTEAIEKEMDITEQEVYVIRKAGLQAIQQDSEWRKRNRQAVKERKQQHKEPQGRRSLENTSKKV